MCVASFRVVKSFLLLSLHHGAHIELRIPRRNLEQRGGLRSLLYVAQFDAAASRLIGLDDAVQFCVYPDVSLIAFFRNSFILHCAAPVHCVATDLRATAPVFRMV